ncbi:MAG: HPr family phosphocarrier protein [Elusimicrobiota bacterium]
MTKNDIKITNELGIHARPAGMIANTASRFACDIKIVKDKREVNAKSIMGIMTLAAGKGSVITIVTNGVDEAQAFEAIRELFVKNFDEE